MGMRLRRKGGTPLPPASTSQAIGTYAIAFTAHLDARAYSVSSIDMHRWALNQFAEWSACRGLDTPSSFTRADLEAYQMFLHRYLSPRGRKPLAINTQLARLGCIRRFFAWLCRSGQIPANPAADLDLPRKQARMLPKALCQSEIQRLFTMPDTTSPFGLRDRALLELFYATGIRRTEMTRLDIGDYEPASRTLTVRKGKGGKSRMLPVGERAAGWLDQFLLNTRPQFDYLPNETALFLSGYGTRITPAYLGNWVKKLMIRCGIDKPGSCHLFRHSCATDMHRGGADIRYVQEMLGHERMETTQIYTHVHIEALREIHTRCHPHGKLGPYRDMHSKLPPPEIAEVDFPFPAHKDPLPPSGDMKLDQCPFHLPPAPVVKHWHSSPQDPSKDDPPPGNAPHCPTPPPKPPPGGQSYHSKEKASPPTGGPPSQTAGVTYYGYRYYEPVTGRWPSRDPIQEQSFYLQITQGLGTRRAKQLLASAGINAYGFLHNASIGMIDLLGLTECHEIENEKERNACCCRKYSSDKPTRGGLGLAKQKDCCKRGGKLTSTYEWLGYDSQLACANDIFGEAVSDLDAKFSNLGTPALLAIGFHTLGSTGLAANWLGLLGWCGTPICIKDGSWIDTTYSDAP